MRRYSSSPCFGSWMPTSISPGVNVPQDQYRVRIGLRKRKKASLVFNPGILKAFKVYCSFNPLFFL